jgi:hypothetical protein
MRIRRVLLGLALAGGSVMASGCVRRGAIAPPTGGHDLITRQELERSADLSLFDAVHKLRPTFLKNRTITAHGRRATAPMNLYVDGERMDSIDDLRRYSPTQVEEVRFYEPHQANMVFGRYNNAGGAIAVILRKLDG